MNSTPWEKRSVISGSLLNPAFCGEAVRLAIKEYNKKSGQDSFPFIKSFLVLPLILHKETRKHLPSRVTSKFHSWIQNNQELRIGLQQRIEYMVPVTREAILFLWKQDVVEFNAQGDLYLVSARGKRYPGEPTGEITAILSKAKFVGKWMSTFPNHATTFTILGIKP